MNAPPLVTQADWYMVAQLKKFKTACASPSGRRLRLPDAGHVLDADRHHGHAQRRRVHQIAAALRRGGRMAEDERPPEDFGNEVAKKTFIWTMIWRAHHRQRVRVHPPVLIMLLHIVRPAPRLRRSDDGLFVLITILTACSSSRPRGCSSGCCSNSARRKGSEPVHHGKEKHLKRWVTWPHFLILVCDIIIIIAAVQLWVRVKQTLPPADSTIRVHAQQWTWIFTDPVRTASSTRPMTCAPPTRCTWW
jgi:hypothetical protein